MRCYTTFAIASPPPSKLKTILFLSTISHLSVARRHRHSRHPKFPSLIKKKKKRKERRKEVEWDQQHSHVLWLWVRPSARNFHASVHVSVCSAVSPFFTLEMQIQPATVRCAMRPVTLGHQPSPSSCPIQLLYARHATLIHLKTEVDAGVLDPVPVSANLQTLSRRGALPARTLKQTPT